MVATFANGGQLVKGNPVQVGGVPVGSVDSIKITEDGQAEVKMSIKDDHQPLHRRHPGHDPAVLTVGDRQPATSTWKLHPDGAEEIDSGEIGSDRTTTAVDLDELFSTRSIQTRKNLQAFFKNQAAQFRDRGEQANVGFQYLNPALATSESAVPRADPRHAGAGAVSWSTSSRLVTTVAERRGDLAALIGNLNTTTRALGDQKTALAESIGRLPPIMRRTNTTFVNLRAALDDLDPLVKASKPVARRLEPFLNQARALAADAGPRSCSVDHDPPPWPQQRPDQLSPVSPAAATSRWRRETAPTRPAAATSTWAARAGAFQETADAAEGRRGVQHRRAACDRLPRLARRLLHHRRRLRRPRRDGPSHHLLRRDHRLQQWHRPAGDRGRVRRSATSTGAAQRRCGGCRRGRSNVLSQEERDRLQCREEHRAVGDVP